MAHNKKKASYKSPPQPQKQAKTSYYKNSSENQSISWRYSQADQNGRWAWSNLDDQKYKKVQEKLHKFEQYSMTQLIGTGSHVISCDRIISEAKKRLEDIQKDDVDELYSFRISAKERIWCIRDGHIMNILWWDPKHEIYPSLKKHT